MQFEYHEIPSLPPLAWCARVDRDSDAVVVFHGNQVETDPRGFLEGAWDGEFASLDFTTATIVCGTGGSLEHGRVRFSGSTDRLSPLFSIALANAIFVSNSPAFAMSLAGEAPDDVYPFYAHDILGCFRQGLYCHSGEVRLRSTNSLRVHFSTMVTIDNRLSVGFDHHRLCESPRDYQAYKALLTEGVANVFANARDPARRRTYRPLTTLSKGYDSSAAAALASSAGCDEAVSFTDSRSDEPHRDCGSENAGYLGMTCAEYDRWKYLELDGRAEIELGCWTLASNVPLAAMEDRLSGRVLVVGSNGGNIWLAERSRVHNHLSMPWARYMPGLGQIEFRLRVGYQVLAAPYIAARHNVAIHGIAVSEDLRPWSIGGSYDKPLARRIAEEAGLPRECFGIRKAATAHSHLTDSSRFSVKGLQDYRNFVRERHADVPRHVANYWRARARLRRRLWRAVGSSEKRLVPSSPLQRRFPFLLNALPIPLPDEFLFMFQWTSAVLRSRYTDSVGKNGAR